MFKFGLGDLHWQPLLTDRIDNDPYSTVLFSCRRGIRGGKIFAIFAKGQRSIHFWNDFFLFVPKHTLNSGFETWQSWQARPFLYNTYSPLYCIGCLLPESFDLYSAVFCELEKQFILEIEFDVSYPTVVFAG